jgi:hypothetical protein
MQGQSHPIASVRLRWSGEYRSHMPWGKGSIDFIRPDVTPRQMQGQHPGFGCLFWHLRADEDSGLRDSDPLGRATRKVTPAASHDILDRGRCNSNAPELVSPTHTRHRTARFSLIRLSRAFMRAAAKSWVT